MQKLLTILLALAFVTPALAADIPPALKRKVDFEKDVAPILSASCVQCHANGKYEADLSIESRAKLIEGGASDAAIVIGKSADSLLIQLVSGMDPERIMPEKGSRLTAEQIGVLRAWIDQGAEWPEGYELHDPNKPIPAKLEPRKVELPPPSGDVTHPIDRTLAPYFAKHNVTPGALVDDRVFARRVYLDIIGLLPPADELEAFAKSTGPLKRARLVQTLLADNDRYATHWLAFWNDLLRNDYKGTGYIDGGRLQITRWLYESLKSNTSYDVFVRQLITGSKGAEGFTKGIVWRGVVNSAQTPQMQAAQNIGQVFMGVNLKCASCHDSFISQWKLSDSYGLAGVFADNPLEMERCDKPLGQTAQIKFLYPQLGTIDQSAPKQQRIEQLSKIVTHQENGRLARTIVNRVWQRMMGRGLIEPVDEMDHPAWNADLLDHLAWAFANEQKYDVKNLIESIALSRAYQLAPAPALEENEKEFVFRGPGVKRMSAEQFVDAVCTVTGVWYGQRQAKLSDNAERYAKARWIWSEREAAKGAAAGTIYFRRTFELKSKPKVLHAVLAVDNSFTLYVNGKKVASGKDNWTAPTAIDLLPHVASGAGAGKIAIAVEAENSDVGTKNPNPAGLWMQIAGSYDDSGKKGSTFLINSDAKWRWSKKPPENWNESDFDDSAWATTVTAGDVGAAPWNLLAHLPDENPIDRPAEVRTALCAADPLTTALGRPNRDQVNTVRPTAATTLMALELTNGVTLNDVLKRGAETLAGEKDVIGRIYASALGRAPTESEISAAKEIIGEKPTPAAVADLLWAVVMLPEFQLIR